MHHPSNRLSSLRRPALLVRAARHGCQSYDRARVLVRLLGETPSPAAARLALLECEADQEYARQCRAPGYRVQRHLDILTALISEDRLSRQIAGDVGA
ncbi:DUF6477 family protein [Pseudooceanicola sp. C21-150M6]|uniref:DUF6477 family protein n=1 Tax=Pseudooceanicola sp. C21-150M6 TaxID=3434355 RepID=UPI003D7FFB68